MRPEKSLNDSLNDVHVEEWQSPRYITRTTTIDCRLVRGEFTAAANSLRRELKIFGGATENLAAAVARLVRHGAGLYTLHASASASASAVSWT